MANIVRSRYVLAAMWLLVISMGPCLSDESDGKASSAMVFDVGSVLPVLCYSSSPAFIFLRRKVDDTAVVALTFDGAERELLHLSGMVSPTSLSCSSDGSTIAVLRENPPSLKCGECRRVYPIQDDIPILLIDAASVDAG